MYRVATFPEEVSDRLINAATVAAHTVSSRLDTFSADGRAAAMSISRADGGIERSISAHFPANSLDVSGRWRRPIIGTDFSTGRDVEMKPQDVEWVPLKDADGAPIGVLFPSKATDIDAFEPWTRMRHRESDLYIRTAYQRVTPKNIDEEPVWAYGPRENAPWHKEVSRTGIPPFYIISHADPHSYQMRLKTGETVFVGGEGYSDVVAGHPAVVDMAAEFPFRPLVPVSCSAGRTGSATGQYAAEALLGDGEMDRNIHVGKSTLILPWDQTRDTSWLAAEAVVDRIGEHLPLFDSYWGSPWSHLDRE
jgi:hypothetical protein